MTQFALVNNVDHKDTRVDTRRAAELGDRLQQAIVLPFEFRDVQAFYPILFHGTDDDTLLPVALFGFEQGENLFLDEAGWHASYIPAMVRKEPFLIGFQKARDAGEDQRVLSINMDHPRVGTDRGEPLFQPLGGRTPYLEEMAGLLETIYSGYQHVQAFTTALREHALIEPVSFDITLKSGQQHQLLGFHAVNEDKVRELPGATLEAFSRQGFLMPLFMVLASTPRISTLIQRKNARDGV